MTSKSDLRPRKRGIVYDLVKEAGIDVSDWYNSATDKPRFKSNPKYCYEWSYVEPGKLVVLNIWYDQISEVDGQLIFSLNMREEARAMSDSSQRRRGYAFDEAIKSAVRDTLPIRMIILTGSTSDVSRPGSNASRVDKRLLDTEVWTVSHYDSSSGQCSITRGSLPRYVDQYSVEHSDNTLPKKKLVSGEAYERSRKIRDQALSRANGRCEFCGNPGFETHKGEYYLETHHIQPLSENGLDELENVAALCALHHRQAHLGKDRVEIREVLQKKFSHNLPL